MKNFVFRKNIYKLCFFKIMDFEQGSENKGDTIIKPAMENIILKVSNIFSRLLPSHSSTNDRLVTKRRYQSCFHSICTAHAYSLSFKWQIIKTPGRWDSISHFNSSWHHVRREISQVYHVPAVSAPEAYNRKFQIGSQEWDKGSGRPCFWQAIKSFCLVGETSRFITYIILKPLSIWARVFQFFDSKSEGMFLRRGFFQLIRGDLCPWRFYCPVTMSRVKCLRQKSLPAAKHRIIWRSIQY